MAKTKVKDFNKKLQDIISQYGEEVKENVEEITTAVGRAAAKELREKSKETFGGSGAYAKGWTSKAENNRFGTTSTVYNKDRYQLAHLLEHGHANRTGGRTGGKEKTEGRPHIKPVEDKVIKQYEKELKDKL